MLADVPPPVFGLSPMIWIVAISIVSAIILTGSILLRQKLGAMVVTYIWCTTLVGHIGTVLWQLTRANAWFMSIPYVTGVLMMTLAGMAIFFAVLDQGIFRLPVLLATLIMRPIRMMRGGKGEADEGRYLMVLDAIARTTYYEALLQPFTLIVWSVGIVGIGIMARLGYFTYNEDFKMYRDVASSLVFLFTMPVMVFASTKVVDEEIENRTMLTLMSKPVSRTQVVLGKYIGVLMLVTASVVILSAMATSCSYMRYYDDMSIDYRIATPQDLIKLDLENYKAFLAFMPMTVLTLLQVSCLAAISVAISTRFGLAVNVTVIIMIYVAASMSKYVAGAPELPGAVRGIISFGSYLLPGLSSLDLNQRLIFGDFRLGKEVLAGGLPTYGMVWKYVGWACVYGVFYIGAVLSFGVGLFRTRELS